MRTTIPLVVIVAILVGPSAFAQSPSQDNAGQIPNNSGAGVPGLPGNKSGEQFWTVPGRGAGTASRHRRGLGLQASCVFAQGVFLQPHEHMEGAR